MPGRMVRFQPHGKWRFAIRFPPGSLELLRVRDPSHPTFCRYMTQRRVTSPRKFGGLGRSAIGDRPSDHDTAQSSNRRTWMKVSEGISTRPMFFIFRFPSFCFFSSLFLRVTSPP